MLNIYNTLSHEKEKFIPIKKENVGIYVCGLTVYDYTHLGHARMLVAFDVIVRHLRAKGLNVTYVRNITDIDDKILERALKNDEVFSDLTARFIEAMHEDEKALAVVPPDIEPRATDYIPHDRSHRDSYKKRSCFTKQRMETFTFRLRITQSMEGYQERKWMSSRGCSH